MGARKWPYDKIKKFIEENNCKLISKECLNANEKLEIQCTCGEPFKASFSKFLYRNKRQCNACSNIIYWNYELARDYIKNNSNCKLISLTFENVDAHINLQCECGNIFTTTFYKFQKRNKRQCNECSGVFNYSFENAKNIIEIDYSKITGIQYYLPEQYFENTGTDLLIIDEVGYKYEITLTQVKSNIRTNNILARYYIYNPYTIENIRNFLKVNNINYKLISEVFTGVEDYLEWECEKGHRYKANFSNFRHGKRCPICNNYVNEREIAEYLTSENINFERQYRFKDCKNINTLPFDFALLDENNNFLGLIEYDGEFHERTFRDKKDNKSILGLHHTKYNDRVKNFYCKANKIPLLRIHYRDKKKKLELINDFILKINFTIKMQELENKQIDTFHCGNIN